MRLQRKDNVLLGNGRLVIGRNQKKSTSRLKMMRGEV